MASLACTPACTSLRAPAPQQRSGLVASPAPLLSLGHNRTAPPGLGSAAQRRQLHARTPPAAASSSGDAAPAAAAAAPAASGHASSGRHAFLHDFCMCIPFGALVAAGGLAGKLVGWGQPATVMLVVGGLEMALAYLSLSVWRKARNAAPYTLAEAGLAGWLAYYAWRAVQQGVASMAMGCLLGLSAAMALFLVYNVAAGGNPPRRGTHAAPAAAPAS